MIWYHIAKKEIRLRTSKFRKYRKIFFLIIYGLFLFWAVLLGPYIIDLLLPDLLKTYGSSLETILHPIIEYSFMMLFIVFLIYPLITLYRRLEIGIKEVISSSPAKPGDIFLGEFLGQLPFYVLIVLAIGPLGLAVLIQINSNLTIWHHLLFYITIFSLISFALLVGNIVANWIEHKFFSKARKSLLNSFFFTILPFIIILALYSFHIIFELFEEYPDFKILTNFIPSFWYSNIVLHLVDPTSIDTYFLNFWLYIILIIGVPLICAYISYKKAEFFYDLEKPIQIQKYSKKIEKFFLKIITKVTPRKIRIPVITQFKEFVRKKENINKMIFLIALNIVFGIFLSLSLNKPLINNTEISFGDSLLIIEVIDLNYSIVFILSWMGGLTFGVFLGIYVFIHTKEIVYLYKKSIRSVKILVFSFLYNMTIICLILAFLLTAIFSLIFLIDILLAVVFFLSYLVHSLIILTQATAIQCIRPLYDEKGKFMYFSIYVIALLQVLSFILSLIVFIPFTPFLNYTVGFNQIILINIGISFTISLLLLIIGIEKLKRTE